MKYKLVIHGELMSSKNSKQIFKNRNTGNMFIAKSKQAMLSEKELMKELYESKQDWDKYIKPHIVFPQKINFKIYRKTHRRFDYTNIIQLLCDCMVKSEYIPDDSAKYLIPVFSEYEVDKLNPRVEINLVWILILINVNNLKQLFTNKNN